VRRAFFIILLSSSVASYALAQGASDKQVSTYNKVIAFVNVNVIPMDSERIIRNQTVLVRDGRITAVGAARKISVPKGVFIIEGSGQYLMPGLVDMHVHLEYFDCDEQLLLFLAGGVTTVRNMDGRPNILQWRQRIDSGSLLAPNIFSAGAILEGNPPFMKDNKIVETSAQAAIEVEAQKKAGYDFIKVYHTLNREAYEAIVNAAKKHGLAVAGHVPRSIGVRGVLRANQKSIEHLDGYVDEIEADDSPLRNQRSWLKRYFAVKVDDGKIRSIAEETRRATVWNVPTLVERRLSALSADELQTRLSRPEMKYLPPETARFWSQSNARITGRMSPEDFASLAEGEKVRNRLVKALHNAGAGLLIGTDAPNAFVIPGYSVTEELQNFVNAGLTPYQAIKAATKDAAEFLNASKEFGTISIGKRADLLLIANNPLESIANLRTATGVMVRGRWVTMSDLQKQLDALSASYVKE
jgi:imidazolonepropionase-like amidohydrolase